MAEQISDPPATSHHRLATWLCGFVLLFGVGITGARVLVQYQPPGPFDPSRQGYCDFHNGIYFPSLAWLRGVSPYGQAYAAEYPVARSVPFFSPAIFVLHAPLSLLPLHLAEATYFAFSIVVVLGTARLVSRAAGAPPHLLLSSTLAIAAGMVFSRGGHITLFDGYFTLLLIWGTFVAIHFAQDRPWLAAFGLLLASAKPTYILPLGLLMLARGNIRALLFGAGLSIVMAGIGFGWIAYHEGEGDVVAGMQAIGQQISETQAIHRAEEDESPVHSWTRLDLLAVVAKWMGKEPADMAHLVVMAGLILPPCFVLGWRRRRGIDDGLGGVTGAIIVTAMLVSLYHQSYDALLMVAPVAGLVICRQPGWQQLPELVRWSLTLLMLVPAYNYLSTRMVLNRLPVNDTVVQVLTSLNGIALAVVLLLVCIHGLRQRPARRSAE